MHIKLDFFRGCMHRNRASHDIVDSISSTSFNLREEYANAFRTESYNEFWARVVDLSFTNGSNEHKSVDSRTTATRLPSYRLFVEHLLDPDQPTITKLLSNITTLDANTHLLLSDYYSESARASLICGRLLRDIDRIRRHYRPLKTNLHSFTSTKINSHVSRASFQDVINRHLTDLSNTLNSHVSFQEIHDSSDTLVKRLENARNQVKAKVKILNRLKCALAVILIILITSTSILGAHVVIHGLAALMFFIPRTFLPSSYQDLSSKGLARIKAQLDVAAKGTYILNRDLDTISRLVERLRDEVEHMVALLEFCRDDGRRLTTEVARQILKNDVSFNQRLNELEEHLYLYFMTINKARNLVMKEVLASTRSLSIA